MLPKPEKISRKKSGDDLQEIPKVIDPEIKIAALKKKRFMVSLGLSITVFLSIAFSFYRYIKTTPLAVPKIKAPSINLNINSKDNTVDVLYKELSENEKIWNITILDSTKDTPINYSNSNTSSNFNFENVKIDQYIVNQKIQSFLPGGVIVKYYSKEIGSDLIASVFMQNPLQDIKIFIKINNFSSLDEEDILSQIGNISQKIYWSLVSN